MLLINLIDWKCLRLGFYQVGIIIYYVIVQFILTIVIVVDNDYNKLGTVVRKEKLLSLNEVFSDQWICLKSASTEFSKSSVQLCKAL